MMSPTKPTPVSLSERTARVAFLVILTLFILLCVYHANFRTSLNTHSIPPDAAHARPRLASRARMLEITAGNTDLTYFPEPDILFMTMAKGGSTSTFNWLHNGIAGRDYNLTTCGAWVQYIDSPCWKDHAIYFFRLSEDERWRILTSPSTLRVAIQRDPFERLLSSWKSKISCEGDVYGTDVGDRNSIVPQLLKHAGLKNDNRTCLSIAEFAHTLDLVRTRVNTTETSLKKLHGLNYHLRPQEFYFEDIEYHMVLDMNDLRNITHLQPVLQRLPKRDRDVVKAGPQTMHASTGGEVLIPESAAKQLYLFAMESKLGKLKRMV